MRLILMMFMLIATTMVLAQPAKTDAPSISVADGTIKFEGVDELGADVFIEYDYEYVKTYQERTVDGVTTFAKFHRGRLVECGTVYATTFRFGNPAAMRGLMFK